MISRTGSTQHRRPPIWLLGLLSVTLAVQVGTSSLRGRTPLAAGALPEAPPVAVLKAVSLGEAELMSAAIVLTLQSFDDQPGRSIPFQQLDYQRLTAWLEQALELDPASDYPLLLAAQVYSQVPDPARQRAVLEFVHHAFLAAPDRRWRWLAHAAIVARHRLHDNALALRYARDIAARARSAPGWARQMQIFLLEDLGEREQAKILLGGLLASGEVRDPAEIRFLTGRLDELSEAPPSR